MADRRLQVFHAVAKFGSFTRAAESLYMTQPAVTFQIKQMEEEYRTRLLDRGHGKVTLTPVGEIVMEYAERILNLSDELELRVSEVTDELSGVLVIGASTTMVHYGLPQLLYGFKTNFPEVTPRLVVGNSGFVEERVASREFDIGLIEIVSNQPTIERRSIARDELFVICSPDHPLAKLKVVKAGDLLPYPFIAGDPGSALRDLAEEFFQAAGIGIKEIRVAAELGDGKAIRYFVAQGMGYALAPKQLSEHIGRNSDLRMIPLNPQLYAPLELITPRDKFRSRLISTFADFAHEELSKSVNRDL